MKKSLLAVPTIFVWMIGLTIAGGIAGAQPGPPPEVKIILSLDKPTDEPYYPGEPIMVSLWLENLGVDEIMRKGWSDMDFWLLLQFTIEDHIITSDQIRESTTVAPPPPQVFPAENGVLIQGSLVELVTNGWFISFNPFDAYTYYPLEGRSGYFSVKAVVPTITFWEYRQTPTGMKYAPRYPTDTSKWQGSRESPPVTGVLVGDADGDGYYYPLPNPNAVPPYNTDVDCDDNNPEVNPGATEIPGNGIDDDCNPDTPDVVGKMVSFVIEKAKIDLKKPEAAKVDVKGKLELDLVYGDGVSISEDVTVVVGPVSETIPGGTMEEKKGKWKYKRPKGGTGKIKKMKIDWEKGKLEFSMDKADLSGLTDPNNVTISIQIGDYFGQQTITMTVKHNKWEYKG